MSVTLILAAADNGVIGQGCHSLAYLRGFEALQGD